MGNEKDLYVELPTAAAAAPPAPAYSKPRRVLRKISVFLFSFWILLHLYEYTTRKPLTDEDRQLLQAFAPRHRPTHGKKPLFGHHAIHEYLKIPNNESATHASRLYATKPHIAGSPQDLVTAKLVLELFNHEFGVKWYEEHPPVFDAGSRASRLSTLAIPLTRHPRAWIDTYYPVLNTGLDRHVQILDKDGNVTWDAPLEEVATDEDPEAGKYAEAVPTWHGLSKGGDVKGRLVYANYGTQEDLNEAEKNGVDFKGAIVLVRYGRIFRGLKIKGAQERGAVGVLIYSDLRDDGTVTVENGYDVYPTGPARNPTSVQRGSVQFISMYPGDPTTPGVPAYPDIERQEAKSIPSIPSLPISWNNAKRLLEELPKDLVGKSSTVIRLHNNVDDKVIPIWNTMAVIPGHIKDEVVVIGNHRDAWVMGAVDPSSGTASMHEVIKGFAHIYRKGWRPLRTIVLASWDAEEYGLVGSTEWVEDFPHFVRRNVVAYLNLDSSVGGSRLHLGGSPSLAHLLKKVAEHIPHPTDKRRTLWDARSDSGNYKGKVDADVQAWAELEEAAHAKGPNFGVNPLGSGSDYTAFLQHIGIPSSDGGFGSTLSDPVYHYHSVYDSERWQETYGDPGFHRHVAVAKYLGAVAIGLTDSIILPLNTTHYTLELASYLDGVQAIADKFDQKPDFTELRSSIHNLHAASIKLDTEKKDAEDHLKKLLRKHRRGRKFMRKLKCKSRRALNWVRVNLFGLPALAKVEKAHAAEENDDLLAAWIREQGAQRVTGEDVLHCLHGLPSLVAEASRPKWPWPRRNPIKLLKAIKRVHAANRKLVDFEKSFISKEGIKDREWYKHLVVSPGKWLGYGATVLPALAESLTIDKNVTQAQAEASRLVELFNNAATKLSA